MKLFADDITDETAFSSPTRAAAAKIMRPLCHAGLSIIDKEELVVAFVRIAEAREAIYAYLDESPEPRAEQTSIGRESLKSEVLEAVETLHKAILSYDAIDEIGGETTDPEGMRAATAYLEKVIRFVKLYSDNWAASRTAVQCRRYDRLLHPERYANEN